MLVWYLFAAQLEMLMLANDETDVMEVAVYFLYMLLLLLLSCCTSNFLASSTGEQHLGPTQVDGYQWMNLENSMCSMSFGLFNMVLLCVVLTC